MARFLSDRWIDEFDQAAGAAPDLVLPAGEPALILQHVVTDVPDELGVGERAFHLQLSDQPARVRRGRADEPTVTFTETYDTAAAISSGRSSAQAAFMAGDLRISGRVDRLLVHHGTLAGADSAVAAIRATTEF